jgi:hypothetical protein
LRQRATALLQKHRVHLQQDVANVPRRMRAPAVSVVRQSGRRGPASFALLTLAAANGCAAPVHGGPLPVRNQHPAQLTVLHLDPAAPTVLAAGAVRTRFDAAYTSLFLIGADPGRAFVMDGEYLRTATRLQVGLGSDLELGAELPFAHTSGGFLDSFIIDYHDLFGFPDQNRSENPRNDFLITAVDGGRTVWSTERDGFELLDVPLHLTWQLRSSGQDRLGLAARAGIELPTGEDRRGYGSGELDFGGGLLADYRTGGVAWYGHLQHTFAGTPRQSRRAGFAFADVTSAGIGVELPLMADLQALVQVEWETSTLRQLGLQVTAREQLLLWVGGRWQPRKHWAVEVAFGEDLQGLVSPDFTAWLGVAWTP